MSATTRTRVSELESPGGPEHDETRPAWEPGARRELVAWASYLEQEAGDGKHLGDVAVADRWASAVGYWLVDASLLADTDNLQAGLEILRSAHARLRPTGQTARLEAHLTLLAEVARAGLDRARQSQLAENLDPASWAARMLVAIDEAPGITSAEVVRALGADDSQVSRSGRALIERGLAIKTRHGRVKGWRASPRGIVTVQRLRERTQGGS